MTVDTSMGTFTIECVRCALRRCASTLTRRGLRRLYVSHAPKTCQNFLEVRPQHRRPSHALPRWPCCNAGSAVARSCRDGATTTE